MRRSLLPAPRLRPLSLWGLIRVHLRLAREGLAAVAVLGLLSWAFLAQGERLLGHPVAPHTLLRLAEEFLVLGALPVAVPLWADVEGRRPALWRALPFHRGAVVALRLVLPVLVYVLVAAPVLLEGKGQVEAFGGSLDAVQALGMVLMGVPVAALLSAVTGAVAVASRAPLAGAAAGLAWWAVESITRGDLSGNLFLFAASEGKVAGPGLVANRLALAGLAVVAAAAAWWGYRRDERFLRI